MYQPTLDQLTMASPIIPWMGGKRRLADTIISRFPAHTCYVEVFAGGAALYFLRQPAEVEVINDINGDVVNLYRVVKSHLEEFVRQFKWALSSREVFKWMQDTPADTLTDIQRAARFYYLCSTRPSAAACKARAGAPPPQHPRPPSTFCGWKKTSAPPTCA